MVKNYSRQPAVSAKSCSARGDDLRVHYKNTFEAAAAIRGLSLKGAQAYLEDVLEHKRCIPFRKHTGHVPVVPPSYSPADWQTRLSVEKRREIAHRSHWASQGIRSDAGSLAREVRAYYSQSERFLGLLKNLEANAEVKGLEVDNLYLWHVQVNRAAKGRRRTYRAHGRIGPYLSSNCHIELTCTEKAESVPKAALKA